MNAIVHEVAALLQPLVGKHIEWDLRLDPEAPLIQADSGQVHHALVNLVLNAASAMAGGGTLTIETAGIRADKSAGRAYALLAVSDTGAGLTEETKQRLFEPFFTTRDGGRGSGLGMAAAKRAVNDAGGWISVHNEPEAGARIELYIPRAV